MHRPALVLSVLVAACGSRAAAPRPANHAAAPAAWQPTTVPRTVAVSDEEGHQVLARVTPTGVAVIATVPDVGSHRGWLDGHTLVGLRKLDHGHAVTRVIDGVPQPDLEVTRDAWPANDAELILGDGAIWLAGCADAPEFTDCQRWLYLRVWPAPRQPATEAPAGRRYGYHGAHRVPAPDGVAPAGASLRVDRVQTLTGLDPQGTIVTCTRDGQATAISLAGLFDNADELGAFHFSSIAARWIATAPPLVEVRYQYTDPIEITREEVEVLRPCETRPLAGFRWIGDGIWAEAGAQGDVGTWTFHRGAAVIGELTGADLD